MIVKSCLQVTFDPPHICAIKHHIVPLETEMGEGELGPVLVGDCVYLVMAIWQVVITSYTGDTCNNIM